MDLLLYEMSGDTDGGVCLKYKLDYHTYEKKVSGCTDIEITGHTIEFLNTGLYILPYINENPNYTGTTDYLEINESMDDWFCNYIIRLSTGNTDYEYRVIFSTVDSEYYKIDYYQNYCNIDDNSRWAIMSTINDIDSCGNNTNSISIELKDINSNSNIFGNTKTISKVDTSLINNIDISISSLISKSTSSVEIIESIINNSGLDITRFGFCYSRNKDPDIYSSIIELNWVNNVTGGTISGLSEEEYYYVKAFAENSLGIVYSNSEMFKTLGIGAFNVSTSEPFNIGIKKLDINVSISNPTLAKIKNVGICWSTGITPTVSDGNVCIIYTGDTYQLTASSLINGNLYYFRSYVITKSFGTIYGNITEYFVGGAPMVGELKVSNITQINAELSSSILDIGWASEIVEAGFYCGINSSNITGNTKYMIADPINSFMCIIPNLTRTTEYYAKAYAISNSISNNNLAFSNEISFSTLADTIPTMGILTANVANSSEIDVSSSVISSGGTQITDYGIWWKESGSGDDDPGGPETHISLGSIIANGGTFLYSMLNLVSNTSYDIKSYAVNSSGTGYSETTTVSTFNGSRLNISFNDDSLSFTLHRFDNTEETESAGHFMFWGSVAFSDIDFNKLFTLYIDTGTMSSNLYNVTSDNMNRFSIFSISYVSNRIVLSLKTNTDYYDQYNITVTSTT
jgi:hypothetical protein